MARRGGGVEGADVLRAGAQLAEVQARFAEALTSAAGEGEREAFAELASAAQRLAVLAGAIAGPAGPATSPKRAAAVQVRRDRLRRRIVRAEHAADWIIARAHGAARPGR
ncbi:hypothetical protein ACIBF1_45175 [Spirillospora sp. NPDC050679]